MEKPESSWEKYFIQIHHIQFVHSQVWQYYIIYEMSYLCLQPKKNKPYNDYLFYHLCKKAHKGT